MSQEEIIQELSKKFNLDEKQVKLIIDTFWASLRRQLTNPLSSRGKILLPHLGSFVLSSHAVNEAIRKITNKEIKSTRTIRSLDFYQELAKVLKDNERQTSKQGNNE